MIKLTQSLCKGGENFKDIVRDETLQGAILHITDVHFCWRGSVSECTTERIVICSRCMDNLDTATYEGPREEMESLVRLTKYFYLEDVNLKFADAERLTIHKGRSRVAIALAIMAGFPYPASKMVHEFRIDDVVSAYVLHKETGCSMQAALLSADKPEMKKVA